MTDQGTLKSVRVNGYDMRHVETGEGEPVVFVHGTISDHRVWDEHLPVIGQSYRAIAPDLRYWGTAPWPDEGGNYSIQTHADDLAAFIRALSDEPATLVGWSHGGTVSLVTAAEHPDLVRRMFHYEASLPTILTDPADIKAATDSRAATFGGAMALVEKGELEAAVRTGLESASKSPGLVARMAPAAQAMFYENARSMPLMAATPPPPNITADDLRGLEMPAAFLAGGNGQEFHKIITRTAAALMPRAELQTIDDAVHAWPMLEPGEFCRRLLDFIART